MASKAKVSYQRLLKKDLSPIDTEWKFPEAGTPPLQNLRQLLLTKGQESADPGTVPILFIKVKQEGITLSVERQSINRILSSFSRSPEDILAISFANFKFTEELPKVTSEYIERLLTHGIFLNRQQYIFFGHSNSQLKSRTCYLLRASHGDVVMNKINEFGDFANFTSVAKRAKRIGLLFSAAEASVQLDKKYSLDIGDIERDGHVFTDGCGMISSSYAQELSRKRNITFQNITYFPSAFQIRYKGYKGMLMVNPGIDKKKEKEDKVKSAVSSVKKIEGQPAIPPKVLFRASMKKFKDCPDDSFSILEYSKPFTYAFLNGELVTLLSCLGIPDETFTRKQEQYFGFLEKASKDPRTAFKYLCYKGEFQSAEDVLLGGLVGNDKVVRKIKRLTREEWTGTFKKNDPKPDNERVRIMIPDSRILYGVCDYTGTLKEGEVHVRVTTETQGPLTITGGHVIVSRNPCLHPGDIRKFIPVRNDQLSHLVDVIVFPVVGGRDPASLMSGGDLDGDKFFVSWDKELIPDRLYEPYGYPPARETTRRNINYFSMIQYFAKYNNTSLGRVKNLYLEWCRSNPREGAGSKECQELNKLFSSCVDGEKIKVPERLEKPPKPPEGSPLTFILDILCHEVKKRAELIFHREIETVDLTPREVFEEILSSTNMPSILDEHRLYLMTLRWCDKNRTSIEEFIHYFDFNAFTTPQKYEVLSSLTSKAKNRDLKELYIGQIFNALNSSQLLYKEELLSANLHLPNIRWQRLYSSFDDSGLRLPFNLDKALDYFHKKLIVFQVDFNLKIAIYIPKRVDKYTEMDVGNYRDLIKLFAFEPESGHTHKSDASKGYRLYFDGEIIQLFEKKRPNTFVWFALNEAFALRNSIRSIGEFKISIALNKFNARLVGSQPRVTKKESRGIEIYVISNRDRVGHQILENSMNSVTTTEIHKILANIPRDYKLDSPESEGQGQGSLTPEALLVQQDLTNISTLSVDKIQGVLQFFLESGRHGALFHSLDYILTNMDPIGRNLGINNLNLLKTFILNLTCDLPILSITIVQALTSDPVTLTLPENKPNVYYNLAMCLILSTNAARESTLHQFERLLTLSQGSRSLTPTYLTQGTRFTLPQLAKLSKLIVYSIRDLKLAQQFLDFLLEGSDGRHQIRGSSNDTQGHGLERSGSSSHTHDRYFTRFVHALALDYLGEVEENCPVDFWGLPLGAENIEVNEVKPGNHLEKLPKLSAFLPVSLNSENSRSPEGRLEVNVPKPHQTCLEIRDSTSTPGAFETILRIDVLCTIRNEDHLRFCASKRANDKPRSRVTVFDATALKVTAGKLTFRILGKPIPPELFTATWNVYICGSTTNLNTMVTALHRLIDLGHRATTSCDDILEIDSKTTPLSRPGNPEDSKIQIVLSNQFNDSQVKAVSEAVNNPMTLIWGPPGTGKTTVVVEIILNFMLAKAGYRILVSASTHNAIDNVMERFLEERKKHGGDADSEDAVRLTSDLGKVSPKLRRWTLDAFVGTNIQMDDKAKGQASKKLKEAAIVFTTCAGAGVGLLRSADEDTNLWPKRPEGDDDPKKVKKKSEEKFDIVIVDEASQITEPTAIIPITKGSRYVILVGDHVQLRPTVTGQTAKDLGLETSLFERLYLSQGLGVRKVMLNTQYRMHPTLCKFSSDQFYDSKLLSGVVGKDRILPKSRFPWPGSRSAIGGHQLGEDEPFPFVFLNCPDPEDYGSKSKCNKRQADMAVKVVKMLQSGAVGTVGDPTGGVKKSKVIILTPYTKQVALLKEKLKSWGDVEVNTIDGFQGREADIIIFVTVRSNRSRSLGFLDDKRRLNVAVTRAKYGLIVIGEENTLRCDKLWSALMTFAKKVDLSNSN